jgi:methylmalonyl-CoA mutase C-terminal domain/subunit
MSDTKPIRVLLAKPGLDGHDQGAKVVVQALLAAGMDVFYTGLRQSPEEIVEAAKAREVDVIGLSIMTGAHLPICTQLKTLFEEQGLGDKLWIVGGNVPRTDHAALEAMGVARVFSTGAKLEEMTAFINERMGRE